MTIVTVDLTGTSLVGGLLAGGLLAGGLRTGAVGLLDRVLAGQALANAAEAVEEGHLRRRHRRFEESEMMLLCDEGPSARPGGR